MQKKIAVFPGSFDPITKGHESVVLNALDLFDEIVVAVGQNSSKNSFFTDDQRVGMIQHTFEGIDKIRVELYQGLTVNFCKQLGARYILRGLRNGVDFDYEKNIAHMNKAMDDDIETIILLTEPAFAAINSTIVREIYKSGGDITSFLPDSVNLAKLL